jgi:hypothetical protein
VLNGDVPDVELDLETVTPVEKHPSAYELLQGEQRFCPFCLGVLPVGDENDCS